MKTGIVVIGRNEGQRLVACLRSLGTGQRPVVYVDSGSTDGSIGAASGLGADVVVLDLTIPFTAARARNAGIARLAEIRSDLSYVQFIDGDCQLAPGWIAAAEAFLDGREDAAVVCGRRRELRPDASIYNAICDIEWDTPAGEGTACGGDALMRLAAVAAAGGYSAELIAGEEPELCLRLREAGWKIWRIDEEMTAHDANISCFGQWWKRTMRGGFAYAAVLALHARSPKRIWLRESARALAWGLALPVSVLISCAAWPTLAVALMGLFPIQFARLAIKRGGSSARSWRYAFFMILAKFAEAAGILKYAVSRISGKGAKLIEYK
jgi:glycosyltransferase involved in cell wall biosynthesis